jgi:serine/threonine protein kinase
VMEYLRGGNLRDRLIQPLHLAEALNIIREICEGLSFAHKNRAVHGNLRPSNIMFTESDSIKITDFGLNEHYHHQEDEANWYSNEELAGSPQGDIFSVGVIFYQMLTGRLPEWKGQKLRSNEFFEGLADHIREIVLSMLGVGQDVIDIGFDQVVARIDEMGMVYDPTTVMTRPAAVAPPVKKPKELELGRIISLFFIINGVFALSIFGYFVFTGDIQVDKNTLLSYGETTKEFFHHLWEQAKHFGGEIENLWGQAVDYSEKAIESIRKWLADVKK